MRGRPFILLWIGAGMLLAAITLSVFARANTLNTWLLLVVLGCGILLIALGTAWKLFAWRRRNIDRHTDSKGRCTKCNAKLAGLVAGAACPGCGARRTRCPQCDYDLTGLPAGTGCPECGAGRAHFPLFVLIPDEQTFVRCDDQKNLNSFEQVDIEDMPHWGWDTKCRKYKLVWRRSVGVWPELVAQDGKADFRAAAEEYRARIAGSGLRPAARGLCDPIELFGGSHCAQCGYNRTGLAAGSECPECGAAFA